MLRYTNKQITTAEIIAKLLELAEFVREQRACGQSEGMSEEKFAFYYALAENGSAEEVLKLLLCIRFPRSLSLISFVSSFGKVSSGPQRLPSLQSVLPD